MAKEVLRIQRLEFAYEESKPIYKDFNLLVHQGEVISIVGSSGVGKSTLFELIGGFLVPKEGVIEVGKIAQVFQDPFVSFHHSYTIIEQIGDVAKLDELDAIIERIGMERALFDKKPHELSGGELQRASIVRAILMKPDIILADEPTSALDNFIQLSVMKLLLECLDRAGVLLITHDLELARWCSDKIIEISPH